MRSLVHRVRLRPAGPLPPPFSPHPHRPAIREIAGPRSGCEAPDSCRIGSNGSLETRERLIALAEREQGFAPARERRRVLGFAASARSKCDAASLLSLRASAE